jgi:AbrB family looped-hinge helix DNA binding protein
MTVTLKSKTEITVPKSIRLKAGIKPGEQIEFSVSGRTINITPKSLPDEIQDAREVSDPKIRIALKEGYQEFLAGKTRPIEEFLAELAAPKSPRGRRS